MPVFENYEEGILVDTEGTDGGFVVNVHKHRPLKLTLQQAKALSEQIGYAVEFVNLYARGPQ